MLQEYDRALARIEEHWRAAPREPVLQLHYATILGHCSRFHAARALLDELVATASADRRLWALGSVGMACCDFQRFDWAAEYLQEAVAEPEPPAMAFRYLTSQFGNCLANYPFHERLALITCRPAERAMGRRGVTHCGDCVFGCEGSVDADAAAPFAR
jgi:hypothetical protein